MTTTLSIQRGDTWEKTYTATQAGAPFDLSQVEQIWLTFRLKKARPGVDVSDSNAALQITLGNGITVADALNGVLTFVLTPEQTKLVVKSNYQWDLQFRLTDGRIKTPDSGPAVIADEVTVSV